MFAISALILLRLAIAAGIEAAIFFASKDERAASSRRSTRAN
jgi:hypothetical protein